LTLLYCFKFSSVILHYLRLNSKWSTMVFLAISAFTQLILRSFYFFISELVVLYCFYRNLYVFRILFLRTIILDKCQLNWLKISVWGINHWNSLLQMNSCVFCLNDETIILRKWFTIWRKGCFTAFDGFGLRLNCLLNTNFFAIWAFIIDGMLILLMNYIKNRFFVFI
jgi:hypothetical protein